ncbi:hypothetical protein INR49_012368 [Caranx melampygus]|nr:hypothetical protein INR49_012368 [Caranx melampygus]
MPWRSGREWDSDSFTNTRRCGEVEKPKCSLLVGPSPVVAEQAGNFAGQRRRRVASVRVQSGAPASLTLCSKVPEAR